MFTVTITLSSEKYNFDGGEAVLLARQWAQSVNHPESGLLPAGKCRNNRIEGLAAERPGEYDLFLGDGTVEICQQGAPRKFISLEPWPLRITAGDLEKGQSSVRVPDAELFLLSFVHEGNPIPNGRVTIYLEMRTLELTTDEAGSIRL